MTWPRFYVRFGAQRPEPTSWTVLRIVLFALNYNMTVTTGELAIEDGVVEIQR